MKRIKNISLLLCLVVLFFVGCGKEPDEIQNETSILVAAAASLRNPLEEKLKPDFEELYPHIQVDFSFDSSGKLQKQIEEGADVDLFFSAAEKQMRELEEKGLVESDSIVNLLQNKIVLIVPTTSESDMESFPDILKAEIIAAGDPESVPVGQYTKELYENMGLWDQVLEKASLGTNVTEVLNWVSSASADAGIVYATDAASDAGIRVIDTADDNQVTPAVYPAGMISSTTKEKEARQFMDFLSSERAKKIFEEYGFTWIP